jgi:outer membrane protein assembly factor BamB
MITKKFIYSSIILALVLISSNCSGNKKTYDHQKAVLVFASTSQTIVDPSLEKIEISIPKQQNNEFWYGFDSSHVMIDNFLFDFSAVKNTRKICSGSSSFLARHLNSRLVGSPVIIGNYGYFLDVKGALILCDLDNQKITWKKKIFPSKILKNYQIPKISYNDQAIFAIAGSNRIVAADAGSGNIIWTKDISSLPISTPISNGKLVFVTTNDNRLYALDVINGEIKWTHNGILKNTAILGSADPVIAKNMVIAAYSSGEIYALNQETGEVIWTQDLNTSKIDNSDFYLNDIDATPIIRGNVIYTIGNGGLMMAINLKGGKIIWKKEISGITDFWLAGDFIYLINNENKLLAISQKNGAIKWISQLPSLKNPKKAESKIIYSGVIMAGNKLIVTDSNGKLLIISPLEGKVEKEIKLSYQLYQNSIIVNSKLYLNATSGSTISLIEIK